MMFCLKNNRNLKILVMIMINVFLVIAVYICLSNNVYMVYQSLFFIPILLSCYWYGKKGLIYSGCIILMHSSYYFYCNPHLKPIMEETVRTISFYAVGLITYKLTDNIKRQKASILQLDRKLKSDNLRLNKAEMLSHLGSYELDLKTGRSIWSDELFRIFGYEPGSFEPTLERRIEFAHPLDKKIIRESITKIINKTGSFTIENRIIRADGSVRWVLSTGYVEIDENEETKNYIGTLLDITERKHLEDNILEEKEKLRITIESIGDGVISLDLGGYITILNKSAEKLTGWTQQDAIGKQIEEVFNIINESTGDRCTNTTQSLFTNNFSIRFADNIVLISRDGNGTPISGNSAAIKDSEGNVRGAIIVFRDITAEKQRQDEIYYMSYYDSLTGIYNRRYFEEEFKRLDTAQNLPISIIMGDVNGLKITNDAFGHNEGDNILRKTAKAIESACKAGDIVARWGGDEFAIMLLKTKMEEAAEIVEKVRKECHTAKIDGSMDVSIAFGWDTKENEEQDLSNILKRAEDHMYKHKVVESNSMRCNIINTIFNTIHEKNPMIESHSRRVSQLCQQLGRAMELSETEIYELKYSGMLHDIGKIAIDKSILTKTEPLTEQEWLEIKRHSEIGYRILSSSPEMSDIAQYVLSHHERFDGTGYPRGLKRDEIPLFSRIIAVADSYDAMTNERSYKKTLTGEMAVDEIIRNKGTQFDPQIADIFICKVLHPLHTPQ